jgi:alkyl hydroperoxide reductase subunit F
MYEVIILGGGPAGLTAAVYVARKKLNVMLICKDLGGQPTQTSGIENYMGYQYIEGSELMGKFEKQVSQFPLEQKTDTQVVSLSRIDGGFRVGTSDNETYDAQTVIIATGARPRELNAPGEQKLRGRGVTYCEICDGPLFAGQPVAVIGGGNSGVSAADDMLKIASHVYLAGKTRLTADPVLIDKVKDAKNITILTENDVVEIVGESRVEAIVLKDIKTGKTNKFDVAGVLVEIGLMPNTEFARNLLGLNEAGEIIVDCLCHTSVPGIFAAGDVTNVPGKQIVVAAGEGAKAALQAHSYLQRQVKVLAG